ncbi:MAG TPA: TIGR03435 family protein [Bryobacteraceae bacterium]|nr:TIGR03435 family protein [Bryobacteraceae bacterium]
MRRAVIGVGIVGFAFWPAYGQSAPQAPAFEVASVKALKMSSIEKAKARDSIDVSPGNLTIRNATLNTCLRWAYGVKDYQISGPSWMDSEVYEIVAKASGPASADEMKPMLQALLADRFNLTLHRDKKEMLVYALIQGKNPPKLRPSEDAAAGKIKVVGNTVTIPHMSMGQLSDLLSRQMERPVLDMTGLSGFFDFDLETAKSGDGDEMDKTQPIVNAKKMLGGAGLPHLVQEQLGLKLEARKLPTEVLVIDRAERVPTEN